MSPYVSQASILIARSSCPLRHASRATSTRRLRRQQTVRRTLSTSTTANNDTQPSFEKPREVKSVLQSARSVLASASHITRRENTRPDSQLEPLSEACDALFQPKSKAHVNVTVCGSSEFAVRNIATMFLDDPLSSDSPRSIIHERWTASETSKERLLRFQHGNAELLDEGVISTPSPFFARFTHPVILQAYHLQPKAKTTVALFQTDIPILVVPPSRPSTSVLSTIAKNPNALLVLDGAFNPASPCADDLRREVADAYSCDPTQVLLLDTARALRGATALSADPSSSSAVRAFQEDMLASGVPKLLETLTSKVSLGPVQLRSDAEVAVAMRSVATAREICNQAKEKAREVCYRASTLHVEALEQRERAEVEILGGDADLVAPGKDGRVARGVERAAADVKPILDGLTWYRLPFVVDEVSVRVDGAVERAFAKEFENELMFHTGRLAAMQTHFVKRTSSLLDSLPQVFRSPVLQNHVAQLTHTPSFTITPTSLSTSSPSPPPPSPPPPALLTPIRTRIAQLAHATRALHLSAQRLLLTTFSSTTLSALGGAALFVNASVDATSAVGAIALGTLIGLRWAVGRWARARDAWWDAFGRVGEGLGRDLGETLGKVLDNQVFMVPTEACKGLQKLANGREEEIGQVEDEVEELEEMLGTRGGQKSKIENTP